MTYDDFESVKKEVRVSKASIFAVSRVVLGNVSFRS